MKYLPNNGAGCRDNLITEYESLERNESIIIRNPSRELYRFLDEPYDDDFITQGKLKIRPLSDYRTEVPASRSDTFESQTRESLEGGINNRIEWITTDSFSLSLSRIPFKTVKEKYGDKSICIKIQDTNKFLSTLDLAVRQKLAQQGHIVVSSIANEIAYCDFKNFTFGEHGCAINQAFIKPNVSSCGKNQYWIENEFRVVWDLGTTGNDLKPIFVENNDLCEHLKKIEEIELQNDEAIGNLKVREYTKEMHKKWIQTKTPPSPC